MRILIATLGSHGDVLPFIAIAKELKQRGHDIRFYSNPYFERYAKDVGIAFVPIGTADEYLTLLGTVPSKDPIKAFTYVAQAFMQAAPLTYKAMEADIIRGETITMGSSFLFASRLLREKHGVPTATVHLAPSAFRSATNPPRMGSLHMTAATPKIIQRLVWAATDRFFFDPIMTKPFNRIRSDLGLPPVHRMMKEWIHQADQVIGMFPEWFAMPQPDWPSDVVFAGFPLYDHGEQVGLPENIQKFISSGEAPIAFTAGTATATEREFFATSVEACKLMGRRGILVSQFAEQVPAHLPANVLHVPYAPFSRLLPHAAAFVHHGGIGTTSQAFRAGVPQLIRPIAYDQFDNSFRATQIGVAVELSPLDYTIQKVADALTRLVGSEPLRENCDKVKAKVGKDRAAQRAADAILQTAGSGLSVCRPA
jgi:rhamnosyltransferase subunit B